MEKSGVIARRNICLRIYGAGTPAQAAVIIAVTGMITILLLGFIGALPWQGRGKKGKNRE